MSKHFSGLALLASLLFSPTSHALFINGGFEEGTFNGWNVTYGNVYNTQDTASPDWTENTPDHPIAHIVNPTTRFPYQTLAVKPYQGHYMAQLNDIFGNYHATRLEQSSLITQNDLNKVLYTNWGAMLVDPQHPAGAQPFFSITILKNNVVVDSFSADATHAATTGWVIAGNDGTDPLYYKVGQYSYNLASFEIGDLISIIIFVTDCGYGAHGGYAFLDSVGTEKPPFPTINIPEPAALALLALALTSLMIAQYSSKQTINTAP
jgi:hypothetical protein